MSTATPAAPEHYAAHAGTVVFPRSSAELSSTTLCPACFTPLAALVCGRCGLDVGHPAAVQLATVSARAASDLAQRLEIIGRIRFETDATRRANQPLAPVPVPVPVITRSPLPAAPRISGPAADPPTRVPRRSSVQILLLAVGVTLLSIAAVFFLVYAFITYGLTVRSIIIAAITVTSFGVSSLLKRRKLRSTAEGIAAFSSLLLFLDAFAVRANDLFGSQHVNGLAYWGVTLVASSVVLLIWNRVSGLRVPSLVGFAAVAPGLGLVAGGVGATIEPIAARAFLIAVVVAAGGFLHPLAARWSTRADRAVAERLILLLASAAALVVAIPTAFSVASRVAAAPALALALCGLVAIIHVVLASRSTNSLIVGVVAVIASLGAVAIGLIGLATPARLGDLSSVVFWAPLAAVPLALGLERILPRSTFPFWPRVMRAATITAAVLGGITLVAPVVIAVGNVTSAAHLTQSIWTRGAIENVGSRSALVTGSIAVLVILGLVAGVLWNVGGSRRPTTTAWIAFGTVLLVVPLFETNAAVVGTWLALGLLATITGVILRPRLASGRFAFARHPLWAFATASTTLGYAASWSSDRLWLYGTLSALAALLVARGAVVGRVIRAAILGTSAIVAMVGAAALAWQVTPPDIHDFAQIFYSCAAVSVLASIFAVLALVIPALSSVERRTLFWIALPTASLAALATRLRGQYNFVVDPGAHYSLEPATVTAITGAIVLGAVAAILIASRSRTATKGAVSDVAAAIRVSSVSSSSSSSSEIEDRPARPGVELIFSSVILAPVVLLALDSLLWAVGANRLVTSLEVPFTSVLVAAGGLVAQLGRRHARAWLRIASDAGIAAVTVVWGGAIAPWQQQSTPWLSLIVLGVAALLIAISADGLFGSRSPRRWLGWLALALGTAGLWSRLGGDQVVAIEPYALPLAGALLAVAAICDRSARTRDPQPRFAPLIALAALLVAVVPIALEGASGSMVRTAIVGLVSAVLLAAGVLVTPRSAAQRDYLAALAFVGAVGVLIVGVGRSIADRLDRAPAFDLWFTGAVLLVLAASFMFGRRANSEATTARISPVVRARAAQFAIILVIIMIAGLECPVWASNSPTAAPYGRVREVVAVVGLSAIALAIDLAALRAGDTGSRPVGWFAIATAAILVIAGTIIPVGSGLRAFSPIEVGTVPIALALLAAGWFRMSRSDQAGSWPTLGIALVLLLAPSLVATLVSGTEKPLWRLVSLGVVAVALVVVGVARRLQAPFVLGSIVLLVHALATFAEQIRVVYEAVPWWLWLGAGGVLIILLAARYEHRIRNLRTAALKIGSLR